jgi:hypothetical protein
MSSFFTYFLIYFCITCFGLSLSQSLGGTVYKLGSGSSLLSTVSATGPGSRHRTQEIRTTTEFVQNAS